MSKIQILLCCIKDPRLHSHDQLSHSGVTLIRLQDKVPGMVKESRVLGIWHSSETKYTDWWTRSWWSSHISAFSSYCCQSVVWFKLTTLLSFHLRIYLPYYQTCVMCLNKVSLFVCLLVCFLSIIIILWLWSKGQLEMNINLAYELTVMHLWHSAGYAM